MKIREMGTEVKGEARNRNKRTLEIGAMVSG